MLSEKEQGKANHLKLCSVAKKNASTIVVVLRAKYYSTDSVIKRQSNSVIPVECSLPHCIEFLPLKLFGC